MRTVLDITDETSPDNAFALPDPGAIAMDRGVVVLHLRELEVRMLCPQLVAFSEAIAEWIFRGCRHEKDLNDDLIPAEEHDRLRKVVRQLLDGKVNGIEVPEHLRWALRDALAARALDAARWRTLEEQLRDARTELEEVREELKAERSRRRRSSP